MHILVTNDDSHRSELLSLLINELEHYGDLTIVVPKHEQSWKGKAMTRFEPLHVAEISLAGRKAFTVDGTPADCVNLAIHNLINDYRPDLVISGVNAGRNTGVGFVLSSGTVGACFEANIANIPAVAISQFFEGEVRDHYVASYTLPKDALNYYGKIIKQVLSKLFSLIKNDRELISDYLTLNINLPAVAKDPIDYKVCSLGFSKYGSCFRKADTSQDKLGRYDHNLAEYYSDIDPLTDFALLEKGCVTLTPLDLRTFGKVTPELNKYFLERFVAIK